MAIACTPAAALRWLRLRSPARLLLRLLVLLGLELLRLRGLWPPMGLLLRLRLPGLGTPVRLLLGLKLLGLLVLLRLSLGLLVLLRLPLGLLALLRATLSTVLAAPLLLVVASGGAAHDSASEGSQKEPSRPRGS